MAAKRMIGLSLWQEGSKLFPNGFLLMYGWMAGTDWLLQLGKLQTLPG
jgi:hypothetical protein